jgi:hypothetical protein
MSQVLCVRRRTVIIVRADCVRSLSSLPEHVNLLRSICTFAIFYRLVFDLVFYSLQVLKLRAAIKLNAASNFEIG